MYSGIVNLRMGNFLVDKSINGKVNFGEPSDQDLIVLNKFNKIGEVGIIICSVEMLNDLKNMLKQLNETKNTEQEEE